MSLTVLGTGHYLSAMNQGQYEGGSENCFGLNEVVCLKC